MRPMFKSVVIISNFVTRIGPNRVPIKNYGKQLANERIALGEDTLTGRILHYLNTDKQNKCDTDKTKPKIPNLKNVTDFKSFKTDKLIACLNAVDPRWPKRHAVHVLNSLDEEFCMRLNVLDFTNIFDILKGFMNVRPNKIMEYKFYHHSLRQIYNSVDRLSKNELLKLIFYVGLQKKTVKSQTMLLKCMSLVDDDLVRQLSIEEICIVCNANFKSSTKITNNLFLDRVKAVLNSELHVFKDSALFTTLIKTIRQNRYQDENLLATVSCVIFFNKLVETFSFASLCHIFALFADYSYYDKAIVETFTRNCLNKLSTVEFVSAKLHPEVQPRVKDIKRLLWCLTSYSHLNVIDKSDIDNILIPKLMERLRNGEFKNDIDSLLDIMLYLWMLDYKAVQLVPYLFTDENIGIIRERKTKSKERLNLLLFCMLNEDLDLFTKLNVRLLGGPKDSFDYQLKQRPLLQTVLNGLRAIRHKTDVSKFVISREVPYINILGITGYMRGKKAVYIEILDEYTCLKNIGDDVPTGLMALKLRLLRCTSEAVIVAPRTDINTLPAAELEDYLLDEMDLVC